MFWRWSIENRQSWSSEWPLHPSFAEELIQEEHHKLLVEACISWYVWQSYSYYHTDNINLGSASPTSTKSSSSSWSMVSCATVVVSLKWLPVPIMTSEKKTTEEEKLKTSNNGQFEQFLFSYVQDRMGGACPFQLHLRLAVSTGSSQCGQSLAYFSKQAMRQILYMQTRVDGVIVNNIPTMIGRNISWKHESCNALKSAPVTVLIHNKCLKSWQVQLILPLKVNFQSVAHSGY